jgi:hypothetical protein
MAQTVGTEKRVATPEALPPLELRRLRDLDLREPPDDGVPPHIASASGVVRRGEFVYVIGDDLLQIAAFKLSAGRPGELLQVLGGDLPADGRRRGGRKPDLEALTALPPVDSEPHGGLLGLGSGSKPTRDRGFFCSFAADGSLDGDPRAIDAHPAYETLRAELDGEVNIEGAAVLGDRLWLLHRANEDAGPNAVAEFELADLSRTLAEDLVIDPEELRALRRYELGALAGVPVCFSDAAMLADELICFTASAEDSASGEIHGSVVGTIDASGEVHRLRAIDPRWKVEGVDARIDTGMVDLLFVCDQDDPGRPSPLLNATMPLDARFDRPD